MRSGFRAPFDTGTRSSPLPVRPFLQPRRRRSNRSTSENWLGSRAAIDSRQQFRLVKMFRTYYQLPTNQQTHPSLKNKNITKQEQAPTPILPLSAALIQSRLALITAAPVDLPALTFKSQGEAKLEASTNQDPDPS